MRWSLCLVLVGLFGCTTAPRQVPLTAPIPPPIEGHVASDPQPGPLSEHFAWLNVSDPAMDVTRAEAEQSIVRANRAALVRPRPSDFTKAMLVYPYCLGCIYAIELAYRIPTHLVWPLEERYLRAWHDEWFDVVHKPLGEPPQDHLLVTSKLSKAEFPKIAKNPFRMTVLTSKGVYYLNLQVQDDGLKSMTGVTWKHPVPPKVQTQGRFPPGVYYIGYQILGDDKNPPVWTPTGVWDTGDRGQMLIHFPKALQTTRAPVLYILGRKGEKHITNMTPHGQWMIVDERFEQAELRLGHEDETAQVVTLRRDASYRAITCPGTPECPQEGR